MSKLSDQFNKTEFTLEMGGTTYNVAPLTVEQHAEMEAWIESELWRAHRRSRRVLNDDEYNTNQIALLEKIGLGTYSYPMPGYWRTFFTLPGLKRAAWLSLRNKHPGLTEDDVGEMVTNSYDKFQETFIRHERADPNPPAGTTEGQPTVP